MPFNLDSSFQKGNHPSSEPVFSLNIYKKSHVNARAECNSWKALFNVDINLIENNGFRLILHGHLKCLLSIYKNMLFMNNLHKTYIVFSCKLMWKLHRHRRLRNLIVWQGLGKTEATLHISFVWKYVQVDASLPSTDA